MQCRSSKIYFKPRLFSNLNRLVFDGGRVQKHYGSAKTRVMLAIIARMPIYMNEYMSPEERKKHEESTLKMLYSKGIPVPKILSSGPTHIVMKRICGISLMDVFASPEVKGHHKLELTRQVGRLVRRIHDADVVHGDLAIKQFLLEPGKHPEVHKNIAKGDFNLYIIDFETKPKKGGHYGRTFDNILLTTSASFVGNLPYHKVRAAFEKGYGKKIDHSLFEKDRRFRFNLLWNSMVLTDKNLPFRRYLHIQKALKGSKK